MRPFGNVPSNFSPDVADSQVARVPILSRFFIGGVNSMRGYAENGVPASGGLAMALVNLEWRIPLAGPLGVEAFVDAGNVWARPEYVKGSDLVAPWNARRVNTGDIRYTYGLGGRLVLPFGPLRIDLAWSDRPDFPRSNRVPFVYQFAIGPSF
jgi:outer membrane protein assembly factor BamA